MIEKINEPDFDIDIVLDPVPSEGWCEPLTPIKESCFELTEEDLVEIDI